jgi:hypothetical protein
MDRRFVFLEKQGFNSEREGEGRRVYTLHINGLSLRPTSGEKKDSSTDANRFPSTWYHVRNRGVEKRLIFRSRLSVMYSATPEA